MTTRSRRHPPVGVRPLSIVLVTCALIFVTLAVLDAAEVLSLRPTLTVRGDPSIGTSRPPPRPSLHPTNGTTAQLPLSLSLSSPQAELEAAAVAWMVAHGDKAAGAGVRHVRGDVRGDVSLERLCVWQWGASGPVAALASLGKAGQPPSCRDSRLLCSLAMPLRGWRPEAPRHATLLLDVGSTPGNLESLVARVAEAGSSDDTVPLLFFARSVSRISAQATISVVTVDDTPSAEEHVAGYLGTQCGVVLVVANDTQTLVSPSLWLTVDEMRAAGDSDTVVVSTIPTSDRYRSALVEEAAKRNLAMPMVFGITPSYLTSGPLAVRIAERELALAAEFVNDPQLRRDLAVLAEAGPMVRVVAHRFDVPEGEAGDVTLADVLTVRAADGDGTPAAGVEAQPQRGVSLTQFRQDVDTWKPWQ